MAMKIWTDGCCLQNPGGAGGWAFVVVVGSDEVHASHGASLSTTNNIMEMTAVVEAMRWYLRLEDAPSLVEILTDSKYVQRGITEWMAGWKKKGWTRGPDRGDPRGQRKPVKNVGLWQVIDDLRTPAMSFTWVKGHAELQHNEEADRLASRAARAARTSAARI